MAEFLAWLDALPNGLVYLVLGLGAAVENLVPAVPADTFVAVGGILAAVGDLSATWVVASTWSFNVAGALFVYHVSRVHGTAFFDRGWGRYLLRPHQMARVERFYARWGTPALFLSRFLPGVRAVAPVFAGTTQQPWPRVIAPIAVASAVWYGGLVQLGIFAGNNLGYLGRLLGGLNRTLTAAAALVALLVAIWWYRTRHPHE